MTKPYNPDEDLRQRVNEAIKAQDDYEQAMHNWLNALRAVLPTSWKAGLRYWFVLTGLAAFMYIAKEATIMFSRLQ